MPGESQLPPFSSTPAALQEYIPPPFPLGFPSSFLLFYNLMHPLYIFLPPFLHNCILPYHVLSPLIFGFFALFMDVPLPPAHLPIFTHYIPMLFLFTPNLWMTHPHLLAPACPPGPIFICSLYYLCLFSCYQVLPPPFPIV